MKTRIINNWKSTVTGVLLLAAAGVLLWFGKITMSEFAEYVPTCVCFIWVKDSVFNAGT